MQINIFPNFFRKQLDQKQICVHIFHLLEGAKMCLYNRFFPTLLNISRIFFLKWQQQIFFFCFLAKIFWGFFFWHFFVPNLFLILRRLTALKYSSFLSLVTISCTNIYTPWLSNLPHLMVCIVDQKWQK